MNQINKLKAFSVAGPVIWNWLPDSMRDPAISRDSFRRSLKTFLLSAYLLTYLLTIKRENKKINELNKSGNSAENP